MSASHELRPRVDGVEKLLSAVKNGDRTQLGALLGLYREFLQSLAVKKLAPEVQGKENPSDLVQETWLRASQEILEFQGATEQQFRAWLQTILEHKAVDIYRRYHGTDKRDISREVRYPQDSLAAGEFHGARTNCGSPLQQLIATEDYELLAAAMQRLQEQDRQVIRLKTYEQHSFEDVGIMIGKSADAACKQWTRALRRLCEIARELRRNDSSLA